MGCTDEQVTQVAEKCYRDFVIEAEKEERREQRRNRN